MKLQAAGVEDLAELRGTFIYQQYKWLYNRIVPGTTVLDIGAAFGDTAIYFCMNPNVKKVYSYEPDLRRFKIFEKTIESSGFKDKIVPLCEKFYDMPKEKKMVIKCDCEGDEYKIFDRLDLDLSNVYSIMMEYHYGIQDLEKDLKSFRVTYTPPEKHGSYSMGYLSAWK